MPFVPVISPQSPQALAIFSLFTHVLILSAVIFVIVAGLVTYGIVRYRARAGNAEPRQDFGSRRMETIWMAIPLLVVVVLFVVTVRTMAFVDAPLDPGRSPDLIVTGRQWWWEARYPNGAVTANEIHIPASTRLLARIEGGDVIHDFWVPQLARKMDAVPGRASYIWLETDAAGTFQGTCSEFCGMQHAGMRFVVVAQPQGDFSAWVQHQAEPSPEPAGGPAAEGARIFIQDKCSDCHAVSGVTLNVSRGPSLAHLADRKLLGGELPNTAENLARWITNPQSIKPGNHMPDQKLSVGDLRALVAYLAGLQ